jgi:adenosylhomocysteinase
VIRREHFEAMRDGAVLANTGHFDVEVDIPALRDLSVGTAPARPHVERFDMPDGRGLYLLAQGRLVNLAAAEGHPAAVMDMSFANQALSAEYVARTHEDLEPRVYTVPREIDDEVARLKLESLDVGIDELTDEQRRYMDTWDEGT